MVLARYAKTDTGDINVTRNAIKTAKINRVFIIQEFVQHVQMDIGEKFVNTAVMKDVKTSAIRQMVNAYVKMDIMEVHVIMHALTTANYAILQTVVPLAKTAIGEVHVPNAAQTAQTCVTKYRVIALVNMVILEIRVTKPALKTAKLAILKITVRNVWTAFGEKRVTNAT